MTAPFELITFIVIPSEATRKKQIKPSQCEKKSKRRLAPKSPNRHCILPYLCCAKKHEAFSHQRHLNNDPFPTSFPTPYKHLTSTNFKSPSNRHCNRASTPPSVLPSSKPWPPGSSPLQYALSATHPQYPHLHSTPISLEHSTRQPADYKTPPLPLLYQCGNQSVRLEEGTSMCSPPPCASIYLSIRPHRQLLHTLSLYTHTHTNGIPPANTMQRPTHKQTLRFPPRLHPRGRGHLLLHTGRIQSLKRAAHGGHLCQ